MVTFFLAPLFLMVMNQYIFNLMVSLIKKGVILIIIVYIHILKCVKS